ncbi:MAG: hypothetical protein AABM67_06595 [Acidobacteriota bacterium]
MNKVIAPTLSLLLLLCVSCGGGKVKLPAKTSIGDLVEIKKGDKVAMDDPVIMPITPPAGEIIYELHFDSMNQISYGENKESFLSPSLVDSTGRVYPFVYAGSVGSDGLLTRKDWRANGLYRPEVGESRITITNLNVGAWPGKWQGWVFTGTFTLPNSDKPKRVAFVYSVPKDARGVSLKDGGQTHLID